MTYKINIGDALPQFTALDHTGKPLTPEDFRGKPLVLYFYPKDDTPGCTKEACSFRDGIAQFANLNAQIVGISPDSMKSHQKFIDKYQLNFSLLCDEEKTLCELFGVLKDKSMWGKTFLGIERTTFVVDSEGVIRWIERPVKVKGHSTRVLQALEKLNTGDTH